MNLTGRIRFHEHTTKNTDLPWKSRHCRSRQVYPISVKKGAQWLSGRVLDSRPRGCGFEPQWRHCVVSLSKNINPSLVLVRPKKTRPFITDRLLMGRKESNQTNKQNTRKVVYI